MTDSSLAMRLLALESFQRDLRNVTIQSVAEQFPAVTPAEEIGKTHVDLNYLLECASVLAHSENGECQDAAFRVAHFVLSRETATASQRAAAGVLLDVLTNRPALRLAIERKMITADFIDQIPSPLLLDTLRREVEFSIADPKTGDISMLNRFQTEVYRQVEKARQVSVSAPTSSGKSYILERAVRDAILSEEVRYVVYIVPTRALIQEVELDFRDKLSSIVPAPAVSSVPRLPPNATDTPVVFVFTQERLHLLLNQERDFKPDLLVIDEAQKIAEGSRGILLEQVLDEVQRRCPDARIVFASPMTTNPEVMLEERVRAANDAVVSSEQIAVNQNLLWVSQVPGKPRKWTMDLCLPNEAVTLGTFELPHKPSPHGKRLPFVAAVLGSTGSIVYVNGAATAEDVARLLADYFVEKESGDNELTALAELSRRTIHRKYALAETVPFGIAFHYGNMPLLIRTEIERLFRAGKLRFLVCTATLIEGVNLPAKSIFVRGPQKGWGKPMSEMDFWNLAGRAGRQGKEFQGNIICVDPRNTGVWKSPPPRVKRRYPIERSTNSVLRKRRDELIKYIENGTPRSTARSNDELESAFVYLMSEHHRWGGLTNSPKFSEIDRGEISAIDTLCSETYDKIELPPDLLFRNPGVSPIAQQNLLEYFRQKENIDDAIPVDPSSDDARESYIRVISSTSKYLSGDPQKLSYPRTILTVNWMRGYPLARLIAEAWDYWRPRGEKLSTIIRQTMAEVEEYVRFRFAKYSSCYVDVLRFSLQEKGRDDLIADIPPLSMWLEFGTSITTQLSLIGLGLSRTSAIELSKIIADDNLEMDAVLARLRKIDLESTNLSSIIVNEVQRLLGAERTT